MMLKKIIVSVVTAVGIMASSVSAASSNLTKGDYTCMATDITDKGFNVIHKLNSKQMRNLVFILSYTGSEFIYDSGVHLIHIGSKKNLDIYIDTKSKFTLFVPDTALDKDNLINIGATVLTDKGKTVYFKVLCKLQKK